MDFNNKSADGRESDDTDDLLNDIDPLLEQSKSLTSQLPIDTLKNGKRKVSFDSTSSVSHGGGGSSKPSSNTVSKLSARFGQLAMLPADHKPTTAGLEPKSPGVQGIYDSLSSQGFSLFNVNSSEKLSDFTSIPSFPLPGMTAKDEIPDVIDNHTVTLTKSSSATPSAEQILSSLGLSLTPPKSFTFAQSPTRPSGDSKINGASKVLPVWSDDEGGISPRMWHKSQPRKPSGPSSVDIFCGPSSRPPLPHSRNSGAQGWGEAVLKKAELCLQQAGQDNQKLRAPLSTCLSASSFAQLPLFKEDHSLKMPMSTSYETKKSTAGDFLSEAKNSSKVTNFSSIPSKVTENGTELVALEQLQKHLSRERERNQGLQEENQRLLSQLSSLQNESRMNMNTMEKVESMLSKVQAEWRGKENEWEVRMARMQKQLTTIATEKQLLMDEYRSKEEQWGQERAKYQQQVKQLEIALNDLQTHQEESEKQVRNLQTQMQGSGERCNTLTQHVAHLEREVHRCERKAQKSEEEWRSAMEQMEREKESVIQRHVQQLADVKKNIQHEVQLLLSEAERNHQRQLQEEREKNRTALRELTLSHVQDLQKFRDEAEAEIRRKTAEHDRQKDALVMRMREVLRRDCGSAIQVLKMRCQNSDSHNGPDPEVELPETPRSQQVYPMRQEPRWKHSSHKLPRAARSHKTRVPATSIGQHGTDKLLASLEQQLQLEQRAQRGSAGEDATFTSVTNSLVDRKEQELYEDEDTSHFLDIFSPQGEASKGFPSSDTMPSRRYMSNNKSPHDSVW